MRACRGDRFLKAGIFLVLRLVDLYFGCHIQTVQMHMAVLLMIVNAQDLGAAGEFTFSRSWGRPDLFNSASLMGVPSQAGSGGPLR
jgi:hypothetical protein